MPSTAFTPSATPAEAVSSPSSPEAAGHPSAPPQLPHIGPGTALFLDFDGTLVNIAAQPEAVVVPPGLVDLLKTLSVRLQGALAIVSGRKLTDLDGFLAPLQLPTASEHGAQMRLPDGKLVRLASPDLTHAAGMITALANSHPGLRAEVKPSAIALHYRQAPELEAVCLQTMLEASRATAGVELLRGKLVFEIKPAGINKGTAIEAFMADPVFIGRVPLFAGDDVTDEEGFAQMQRLGGDGIKVGAGASLAFYRCGSPAALLEWLTAACAGPSWLAGLDEDERQNAASPVLPPEAAATTTLPPTQP